MTKPKLRALDLFCGGGGVAQGLIAAGFEVVGIDIADHSKFYPGHFIQGDALAPEVEPAWFDLVWASPPCQFAASPGGMFRKSAVEHVNLIPAVRTLIQDHPMTVIENIPAAAKKGPMRQDLVLTGPTFGLNRIERKRIFELSFPVHQPRLRHTDPKEWARGKCVTITTSMSSSSHYYARRAAGLPGRVPKAEALSVMGITHDMTTRQIGEAIPPAYAEYIGQAARKVVFGTRPSKGLGEMTCALCGDRRPKKGAIQIRNRWICSDCG